MRAAGRYEEQRGCARRALSRVFVAGLARRMARTGVMRVLSHAVAGLESSLDEFPSKHLDTLCASANKEPLRRSGVAAGGAGGGGSGDFRIEVSYVH